MYLGVELDSAVMRARLSQQRMETLWSLLRRCSPGSVVSGPPLHEAAGHDVGRPHGGAAGAASHEAAAEMVFSPKHRPGVPTAAQSDHSPISGPRFDPLGRSPNSRERGAVGQSNVTHLSVHGCFSVGLGRKFHIVGSVWPITVTMHKRIGAPHSVESGPTLCPNT